MMIMLKVFFLSLLILYPVISSADENKAKPPIPRFVSIHSNEVNVRTGPGVRYPIKWTIVKENIPVEIIAEYEDWRKIRDISQDEGWVNKNMLSNSRSGYVKGNNKNIFSENNDKSKVTAIANKGTLLNVVNCDGFFCEVRTSQVDGFIHQENLFGIYEGEKFKNK